VNLNKNTKYLLRFIKNTSIYFG